MAKIAVAPLVGAWIEINSIGVELCVRKVAPLVGAWIEITRCVWTGSRMQVAPLVGAWIEIPLTLKAFRNSFCRSPRGSVD